MGRIRISPQKGDLSFFEVFFFFGKPGFVSMGCQGVDHFIPYPADGTQLAFAGFQDQAGILTEFVKQVTVGDGSEATDRVEQKEGV